MKKFLKILGYGFGALLIVILSIATWIQFSSFSTLEHGSLAVTIPKDSLGKSVGRKIVEERCLYCHLGDDGKLSGKLFTPPDSPFGVIWSKNITQHSTKGIGDYTDGELAFLLRTGINKHGRYVGPFMVFPILSDEDLGGVLSYLRSDSPLVQPANVEHPLPQYSFLLKALVKLGVMSFETFDSKPIQTPSSTDTIKFGRYLSTARYACFMCHSASFESVNDKEPEKSEGYFGGGNEIFDQSFNSIRSANITMSKANGIGKWTKEQFIHALRTGERPDGKGLSPAMPRLPLPDENELEAIWKYLQTVPVLENHVAR